MKKIIFSLLFLSSLLFAKSVGDDPARVKDALVDCYITLQDVIEENNQLKSVLEKVENDLIRIQTVEQLDSLRIAYGLKEKR